MRQIIFLEDIWKNGLFSSFMLRSIIRKDPSSILAELSSDMRPLAYTKGHLCKTIQFTGLLVSQLPHLRGHFLSLLPEAPTFQSHILDVIPETVQLPR